MMKREAEIVIIGATGLIGETLLQLIAEHPWLKGQLELLGGSTTIDEYVDFGGSTLTVDDAAAYDFKPGQIVISSGDEKVDKGWLEKALDAGCIVLDLGSTLLMEYDLPPVVASVNPGVLEAVVDGGIIALPGAATVQLTSLLKPIIDLSNINRVSVVSCHAVSELGRSGVEEMARQTALLLNAKPAGPLTFEKQIAFNLIPLVGSPLNNGLSDVERRIIDDTRQVLGQPQLDLSVNCCWVPVFFGHSQAITLQLETPQTKTRLEKLLTDFPGMFFFNTSDSYPTAVTEASGKNDLMVGRLIAGMDDSRNFTLWTVADNLRFGLAGNAVRAVEVLVKDYL